MRAMSVQWLILVILAAFPAMSAQTSARHTLEYAPSPVDNPLKGLVPYAGNRADRFPHSMEFNYLPLGKLVVGPEIYDWEPLEKLLDEVAGRGHQAIFRVYMEFPGKTGGIPGYLVDAGLTIHKYRNTNTQPFPQADVETPDYSDPRLRKMLVSFIAALGRKYDGDPRIGFITAGLLGTWGEWHCHPRNELFADKSVQAEVMDAYEAAFKTTPILLRYPAGPNHGTLAPNADRRFGYHDDSFAWGTLATGRREDDWFFMPSLRRAGRQAMDKWQNHPIGGEIRPEAWGKVFDDPPGDRQIQDFAECVRQTHATWLMDNGMFNKQPDPARRKRAEAQVRALGYEYHVPAVTIRNAIDGILPVVVEVENRGVAPFYSDWSYELGLFSGDKLAKSTKGSGKLTGILPGDPPRKWADTLNVGGLPPGKYRLSLRVANPLPKGHPLRFANKTQDQDASGWLTLDEIELP